MTAPFDLFKEDDDGVQWLEEVSELEAGKEKARERMMHSPGSYFLYDRRTGNRLYISLNDNKEEKT